MAESRRWPAPLAPGDVVRVVAPAGPVDADRLRRGAEIIASWGLTVRSGDQVLTRGDRLPYLAGADRVRAADFTAAWTARDTAAVWAARGGYGVQRMLELVDWAAVRVVGPKHLVGFSDITALHGRLGRELDQVTIHGPMAAAVEQLEDAESARALQALVLAATGPGQLLVTGRTEVSGFASGRLWGGNLSVLASEVGIEPAPAEDVIMVLEEVGEPGYRVDRMLTQLLRSGWLDRVRGVLVGVLGATDSISPVVTDRLSGLGIPVVVDAPAGHGVPNLALPLGALVTLDATAATGTLRLMR